MVDSALGAVLQPMDSHFDMPFARDRWRVVLKTDCRSWGYLGFELSIISYSRVAFLETLTKNHSDPANLDSNKQTAGTASSLETLCFPRKTFLHQSLTQDMNGFAAHLRKRTWNSAEHNLAGITNGTHDLFCGASYVIRRTDVLTMQSVGPPPPPQKKKGLTAKYSRSLRDAIIVGSVFKQRMWTM